VLRAAIEVFNRQGYDGTSIADVARELGVTKSAVYHHVPSKEHILAHAVDEALDALGSALDEVDALDADAGARLRHAVRRSVEVLLEHLPAVTLLLRVRGNIGVEQRALERRREIDHRLARMVSAAAEEGAIRADLDPLLVSRLLFGMVNSLVEWARPDHDADHDVDTLADHLTAIAFEGLQS